jgi:oligopeptidase A
MPEAANPLLQDDFRIPFHRLRAEHVEPGIREALREAETEVDAIARSDDQATWSNTIGRLDMLTDRLARRISPASHLVSVAETPELRNAFNAVLPEMSAFWSSLPLNEGLWKRLRDFCDTEEAASLEGVARRHLQKTLREFRRAGADLPDETKARLQEIRVELAQLQQRFSENVLDATAGYEFVVTDDGRLAGMPDAAVRRARARATEKDIDGWLLTLDFPSVEPVLKYCEDRELRQTIFTAFSTRCRAGEHDNRAIIGRILRMRHELASVLGYPSFPDYVIEDRMAGSGARAVEFERDLVERTRPYWEKDTGDLSAHAAALDLDVLEPWDVAYVTESLRKERYDIDDEAMRPYFPLPSVLAGMFEIAQRVFGFRVQERQIEEVWHEDVGYYEIFDEAGTLVGAFYCDWFPRKEKRQGAWMDSFVTGGPTPDGFDPHLGVICGNFTPPDGDGPALLTHREVETTFHEFGHLLHHCTSKVAVRARAGINVAWDWVELPSQLMENWCWEREALDLFARHHETGEAFPQPLFERMVSARRFMRGWAQMRQLSYGTVDLFLHGELAAELDPAQEGEEADARQGARVMEATRNHFQAFSVNDRFADYHILTSFGHLFAGGYAAGYYSYLWSEVLDADVFTRFRSEGIFNGSTGRSYVASILSRGDSAEPEELFREFMGRDPDPEALMDRNLGPLRD